MATNIAIVDTGFWFALLDKSDSHHSKAIKCINEFKKMKLLIPWPTLYEVMNTRFVDNPIIINNFKKYLSKPTTEKIDDSLYKAKALEFLFYGTSRNEKPPLSLVDIIIKLMIEDVNIIKHCLFTVDHKNFFPICNKKNILLLPNPTP